MADHRAAWLKFATVVMVLSLAGLGWAYWRGWGVFRSGYYQRHLETVSEEYFASYRQQIINQSGLETALGRLKEAEAGGGIWLTLHDLLRGENGRWLASHGERLARCNQEQTIVRIIPAAPYGAKDFQLELQPRCA